MDSAMKALAKSFVDKVMKGDETDREDFSAFCSLRGKTLVENSSPENLLESLTVMMEDYGTRTGEPVSLDGDFILVNGKRVGRVDIDVSDFESGINFTSIEGNFSKEFNTVEDLFAFISQKYLGQTMEKPNV